MWVKKSGDYTWDSLGWKSSFSGSLLFTWLFLQTPSIFLQAGTVPFHSTNIYEASIMCQKFWTLLKICTNPGIQIAHRASQDQALWVSGGQGPSLTLNAVHSASVCICVLSLFSAPWTVAHQDPLPMEFSSQEYWRRFPFPTPGDLPDPGIQPGSISVSPALPGGFFTTSITWEAHACCLAQN